MTDDFGCGCLALIGVIWGGYELQKWATHTREIAEIADVNSRNALARIEEQNARIEELEERLDQRSDR